MRRPARALVPAVLAIPTVALPAIALVVAGFALFAPAASAQVTTEIEGYKVTAPDQVILDKTVKELTWSRERFEDLFHAPAPKGHVVLRQDPNAGGPPARGGDTLWTLPWFAGAMPGMPAGAAGGMNAMTHEAAHLQLVHLVNDGCVDSLKSSFNGYGSYLPDWIDECVAVYHEPGSQKKERRTQLKSLLGKHIPLAKLFTMDHPIGGKGAAGLPPGMQPPPGGGVGGGALPPGALGGMGGEANTYYVESLSVIEYLIDRSGKPFFRFCVANVQQGKSMDEVLAAWAEQRKELKKLVKQAKKAARKRKSKRRSKKTTDDTVARDEATTELGEMIRLRAGEKANPLPKTVADLERDWLRWVKAKYPGYKDKRASYPSK